ncbi:androgen-induced gene 1 family protein [Tateyamaria omphalii]|uniref:androgen-induced gene 1 family protein n=1 Tax=Tateyamaria omphalii TaxID=299262 RepID=UPI001C99BFEC|nr:androgen-induced gene 1 family protein [Tateyamaria omphalii]MBY5933482.1 androgen-induced gene 1 family protein [Tateyamaria omphalii]
MDIHSRPILIYRWIVFLLAAGYCLYQIIGGQWSGPGGPFRYLTIWALFLSFYAASRMLALSEHRITRQHEVTAMCAAVLNVMVVFLYWRLYLTDPSLVNGGGPIVWWLEYYLHALGPALQIIDALFVGKVFRRVWRAALPLIAIIAAYVAWAELFVQRFNTKPTGDVTSGLPYPFLNSMEWGDRAMFYSINGATALGLLMAFGSIGALIHRLWPRQVAA